MAIAYSDGAEEEVLRLLEEADDLTSTSISAHERYAEWPIRYHLCPERSNLLRHFDFAGLDVLELGAGMGAASRYVAENARAFVAVEGTENRAAALRSRLRDLDNWEAVVSNIQDYKTERRFDVVLLIGVLEYAEMYIQPDDGSSPFDWLLRHASSMLKPDGRLIVAIENRNGVKYWAGAPEDHTGRMFDGICGYTPSKTPRTFSRKTLLDHCRRVGLENVDEFYPWPDYKTPCSVVSKTLVDRFPFLAADIAADATAHEPLQMNCYFPWTLALREVARSGLLTELANSFLFVAGAPGRSAIRDSLLATAESRGECAWHYSIVRREPIQTAFRLDGDPEATPTIHKQPFRALWNEVPLPHEFETVNWSPADDQPAMLGTTVLMALRRAAFCDDLSAFMTEFGKFLRWAVASWSMDDAHMRPKAFDLTPSNAVQDGASYSAFDLEWESREPMAKSWFVLRCLLVVRDALALFPTPPRENYAALYAALCAMVDAQPDLKADIEREAAAQTDIQRSMNFEFAKLTLTNILTAPWLPSPFPHDPQAEQRLRAHFGGYFPGWARISKLLRSPRALAGAVKRRAKRALGR